MSACLFNFPDADLTLRSGPGSSKSDTPYESLDFLVHRHILSAASPFFETMLSIPQPPSISSDERPIVPFVESAAVLEALLHYIYPVPNPHFTTLESLIPVLEAAHKYDIPIALEDLRKHLIFPQYLHESPLRVYAIASRYEFSEETRIAAAATLSVGLLKQDPHEDLKSMTAYSYHQLLMLHERRAMQAVDLLLLPPEIRCRLCNPYHYDGTSARQPKWWAPYRERARDELRVRPVSATIVSMAFLQKAAQEAGCEQCGSCILASHWWFEQLRDRIDALPTAV